MPVREVCAAVWAETPVAGASARRHAIPSDARMILMALPLALCAAPRGETKIGDPGRARTCNRLLRRQMLYPVELRGRAGRKDAVSGSRAVCG